MSPLDPRRLWCWPRAIGLASATLLLVMISTSSAQAHTDLLASSPTAGARVSAAPSVVTLRFSEDVSPDLSTVSLQIDGSLVGELAGSSGSGRGTLVARVPTADLDLTQASAWTVGYRVTSVDGHPISGTIDFSVTAPISSSPSSTTPPSASIGAQPAETASPNDEAAADGGADAADEVADEETGQTWWVPAMVLLLVALGAVAALRLGRASGDPDTEDGLDDADPTTASRTDEAADPIDSTGAGGSGGAGVGDAERPTS